MDGEWAEEELQICREAVSYFEELFTVERGVTSPKILNITPKIVTDQEK